VTLRRVRHPLAALAAANLVYAGAFPASEVALRDVGPVTLVGLRFTIAAGLLAPIAIPVLRGLGRRDAGHLLAIAAIGLWGQMVLSISASTRPTRPSPPSSSASSRC
jgi:drug/metabolite transporter (DMT)-like permease